MGAPATSNSPERYRRRSARRVCVAMPKHRVKKDHPDLATDAAKQRRWRTPRKFCSIPGCGGTLVFSERDTTQCVVYTATGAEVHCCRYRERY